MKKLYLFGNLKMNLNKTELTTYFEKLKQVAEHSLNVVGVALPVIYLPLASQLLQDSRVLYGAQNMFYEDSGAYTGETSALMLKDYNATFVLVGHSERRNIFLESDTMVNKKVHQALKHGLMPIVCVGETLSQKEQGQTKDVVKLQLHEALQGVTKEQLNTIIIAYEPVWAIGTGKSATSTDAKELITYIKQVVSAMFSVKNSDDIIVLYGGSLNENNASELLNMPNIDGGLIGGASLKVESFEKIIYTKV